ncbi:MAG: thiamine-monophosphate kinase, partial [Bacteroidetes bacterium]|nr:thiamine-monophosphate kinase [Bacteroidota bacterium]
PTKKLPAQLIRKLMPALNIRWEESKLIRSFARCCIDTSDGLANSLHLLSDINRTGFILDKVPYYKPGLAAARLMNKPKELLLLGECGEYELLFTVAPGMENDFLEAANHGKLHFTKIGTITEHKERLLNHRNKILDLGNLNISARRFPDVKEYLSCLTAILEKSWRKKE